MAKFLSTWFTDRLVIKGDENKDSLRTSPSDYQTEVSFGNIEGESSGAVISKNRNVTTGSFQDLWGEGGVMTYPSFDTAELLELVSFDANDTDGGTGTWSVLVVGLDVDFNEQSEVVTTNGGTVTLALQYSRVNQIISLTAGSNEVNVGDIVVRVLGGGNVRDRIIAADGVSYNGHFTVPAGKRMAIQQTYNMVGKDSSCEARFLIRNFGADSSWVANAPVPLYQNMLNFNLNTYVVLEEKTDVRLQAKSDSGNADVGIIFEYLLRDV